MLFTCIPKHLAFFMQYFESSIMGSSYFKAEVTSAIFGQSEIDPDGHWSKVVAGSADHRIDSLPIIFNGDP